MRYIYLLLVFVANHAYGQSYYQNIVIDKVTVNYPDHKVIATVVPVKGQINILPEKYYYWYSANGIKVTQGGYSNKLLNGPYSDFYGNKNLKEKGSFKNGLKIKKWHSWNEMGFLLQSVNWKAGVEDGRFYRYDGNGNLREKGRYQNGQLEGRMIRYSTSDSSAIFNYKKGKVINKKKRHFVPQFIKKTFGKIKS